MVVFKVRGCPGLFVGRAPLGPRTAVGAAALEQEAGLPAAGVHVPERARDLVLEERGEGRLRKFGKV